MKIFRLLLVLLLGTIHSHASVNVIYLNADDLGVMDVGFMGSKIYHTPNLDRLAKEGMIFTEAYAPAAPIVHRAGQPVLAGNGHHGQESTRWVPQKEGMPRTVCLFPRPIAYT